jgi:hypothetical protein
MVIGTIYQDDPNRRFSQGLGGRETAKAATDDHHYRQVPTYRFGG